jgi:hypothetical protein
MFSGESEAPFVMPHASIAAHRCRINEALLVALFERVLS